jgi:hypothetical protein
VKKKENKMYVIHFCKSPKCNAGWLDLDLTFAKKPPKWKYCVDCVSKGLQNPAEPPKDKKNVERAIKNFHRGDIKIDPQHRTESPRIDESIRLGMKV